MDFKDSLFVRSCPHPLDGFLDQMIHIAMLRYCCFFRRALGKIQYLKDGAVKGDEIFFDQIIAGFNILIHRHLKQIADAVVTVKRKPVAVCCQNKEKIQLLLPWVQI